MSIRLQARDIYLALSCVGAVYGVVHLRKEVLATATHERTFSLSDSLVQPFQCTFSQVLSGISVFDVLPVAIARASSSGGGGGGGGGSGSCGSGGGQGQQQQQQQPTTTSGSSETGGSWQEAQERLKKSQVPPVTYTNFPDNLTQHCLKKNKSKKSTVCGVGAKSGSCRHAFDAYTTKASLIPYESEEGGSCVTVKAAGSCGVCGRLGFKEGGSGEACTPHSSVGEGSFACRTDADVNGKSEDAASGLESTSNTQSGDTDPNATLTSFE